MIEGQFSALAHRDGRVRAFAMLALAPGGISAAAGIPSSS
jgi:hypothetical protein